MIGLRQNKSCFKKLGQSTEAITLFYASIVIKYINVTSYIKSLLYYWAKPQI